MGDDLVPEEVEIDPFVTRSTFRTTEHTAVKGARPVQVVNGKGQVKTRSIRHGLKLGSMVEESVRSVTGFEGASRSEKTLARRNVEDRR